MGVTLVKIDISKGLVTTVTAQGVEKEQFFSTEDAFSKVAEYMDLGYEVVTASADIYILKKPKPQLGGKDKVSHRPTF